MLSLRERVEVKIHFELATARLTETILGNDNHDLAETLRTIASDIGLSHIAYLRLSPDKSPDICLLVAVVTYSRLWQHRYFVKEIYEYRPGRFFMDERLISLSIGPTSLSTIPPQKRSSPMPWNHNVGRNGLSIPLRNRRGVFALVSFTSDLSKG